MTGSSVDNASACKVDANECTAGASGDLVHVDSFWTAHAQKLRASTCTTAAPGGLSSSRRSSFKHADSLKLTRNRMMMSEADGCDASSSEAEAPILEHVDSFDISSRRLMGSGDVCVRRRSSLLQGFKSMVFRS
eukprot:TRINITY_DN14093_c0_g2_i1.p1 TRINITY_DN14093_c0_g2~~TRINITY_DN14093_c0_g2_i1.p1  ORF type:complete len:156 (+),score=20.94 TRINITY_DN14093_c0_g2_i1:67-468(+)